MFFANIGINANFSGFNATVFLFGLAFVTVGIAGKIIGCGGVAKLCRYSWRESAQIGVGMIARGEVALAVYSAGQSLIAAENGLDPLLATIMLILISSIVCPILLKLLFKDKRKSDELPLDNPPAPEQI